MTLCSSFFHTLVRSTAQRLLPFVVAVVLTVLAISTSQAQILGVAETDDDFGDAVATGDFNGDGRADLAVGVPGEDGALGAVSFVYGASDGLTTMNNELRMASLGNGNLGSSLAAGDFNGDGYDDLAAGAPMDNLDNGASAGSVWVFVGSEQGISFSFQIYQADIGATSEEGDLFGFSLAAGDFNADDHDDLAIGIPGERIGSVNGGEIAVLYGTPDVFDFNAQFWNQGQIGGTIEDNDAFGRALTAGNFNGDAYDDLAVGAPGETVAGNGSAGEVYIIYGTSDGLNANGFQNWGQYNLLTNDPEILDQFGYSLAAGDFDGDGRDDLIAGVPGENNDQGTLHVIYGGPNGLTSASNNWWWQGDIAGTDPNDDDRFGFSLAVGNFDGDAYDDLAVGAPGEDRDGISNLGEFDVFYGSSEGIRAARSAWYIQGFFAGGGGSEPDDRFGTALAAGDFNADGEDDLAIGVPSEDIGSAVNAGAVNVIFGQSGVGLNIGFNQFFYQGVGIVTVDAEDDRPGAVDFALASAYPNPFSEATTLHFTLLTAGTARLAVYDVLGREVAVLVDGVQAAGAHEALFDATGLAAGVYVVRLQSGTEVQTTRLTLTR